MYFKQEILNFLVQNSDKERFSCEADAVSAEEGGVGSCPSSISFRGHSDNMKLKCFFYFDFLF